MTIRTKPASKEYRDGWDRVFGKRKREPEPPALEWRHSVSHDWYEARLRVHGAKPSAIRERMSPNEPKNGWPRR